MRPSYIKDDEVMLMSHPMTTPDVPEYEVLASYVRHVPEKRRVGQGWTASSDIVPAYDEYVEIRRYNNMEYDQTYQRWENKNFKAYMTEADALDWVRSIHKKQQTENGVSGPAGIQMHILLDMLGRCV